MCDNILPPAVFRVRDSVAMYLVQHFFQPVLDEKGEKPVFYLVYTVRLNFMSKGNTTRKGGMELVVL